LWDFPLDNIPTLSYDDKKKEVLHMNVISLTVDSKKRISLTKLLPPGNIRSVQAYTEGHRIVLEPMMEVPIEEVWLFKNKDALKRVLTGLSQNGSVKRGSFARRAK
jgi:hypothetical protein